MQVNIDLNKLRQDTNDAIEEAKRLREQRLAKERFESELKKQEMEAKAQSILVQIPTRCAVEAKEGRSHAIVYSLGYDEYRSGPPYNKIEPHEIKGVGALVWNACQKSNLQPTLEYWHDGCGMKSGFNIVVHW
jgi:hypothetical protein